MDESAREALVDSPEPSPSPTPPAEPATETLPRPEPIQTAATEAPPAPAEPVPEDVLAQARALVGADGEAATADASSAVAVAPGAPGGGSKCEAGGAVLDELLHDEQALAALERLPRDALSVAGAVQLWNGTAWVDEATMGGAGSTLPIRQAIVRVLDNSPPECLSMVFRGPRFLVVPVRNAASVTVVLGSGEWRWADALAQSGVPSKVESRTWSDIVPRPPTTVFPATADVDRE